MKNSPPSGSSRTLRADAIREHRLPLSLHQERLWFLDQLERGNPVHHLAEALELTGPLERAALEDALGELLRRHQVLRTRIDAVDGRPAAAIAPARTLALPLCDLGQLAADARRAEVRRRALAHARRPFELARGPLLRAALLRLSEDEHVLLLCFHRLAADAGSLDVARRELPVARSRAPLPCQYTDVARRQRQWLRGEDCARQLAWWRRRLAGAPAVVELPTDHPRQAVPSYRGARRSLALPAPRSEVLVLAAFNVLLLRTTGQQEIVVGSPVAERGGEEGELIGPLANPLVLRTDLSGDPEFRRLMERIAAVDRAARAHRALPFERLVEELQPERDLNREPLFQVRFIFRAAPPLPELPDLGVRRLDVDYETAEFDWTLEIEAGERTWTATLEYNADLFDATTIRRALGHYRILLEGIAADPATRLSELPLLGDAERHQLLAAWNDTRRPYPDQSPIHELFAAQAAATPEAVAAVFAGEQVTYRELDRRANRLAHSLRNLGVGPEVGVGLCVERSVEMLVGILGILKAGGAYVPLDPSYPAERLSFMFEDVRMPVLVSQRRLLDRLPIAAVPELRLLCLEEPIDAGPEHPSPLGNAENLAYVMYTSGSTGRPKGVSVTHRGVVRLIEEANYAELNDQVFLQFAPISFDASTLEIWGPLLTGGRLVIFPAHTPSLEELGSELDRHRVTTLWLTAGLFHQMVDENPEGLGAVRQLLAGGDVLSARHVRRVLEELPACTLINGYGPTESTTFTACLPMRRPEEVGESVSIGRPITHTRVYVLDRQLQAVGIGIFGELTIAGDGLARGYLNRPQLTAERFVPSPWGRLYRTGDVVRFLADGRLEFGGRRDDQVKVRGFRIELGEVEAHLGRHPGVRESAVVVEDDRAGGKRLRAFVVAEGEPAPAAGPLRDFLRRTLPEYMVPGMFVPLESLPLTPNGKVDRAALGRASPAPAGAEELAAPRTPTEEMLATIWAEVLDLERVGMHDDFFDLGGHSLLATRVIARVREAFGVELPLRIFFEAGSVGTMAAQIETARRRELVRAAPPLVPVPRAERLPLSFAQQRLWFLDQYQPQSAVYNIYYAFRLRGPLDPLALERSLNEIVRRHEALRTLLVEVDGEPRQRISEYRPFPLPVVDLTTIAGEDELLRLAGEEARRPFDLAAGPLMRVALLRADPAEHIFLLSIHHVATDGWSMGLFHHELGTLYAARSPLPELPIQYADFALWQRQWLRGEVWESQLAYWKGQLEGMRDAPELPVDRPRPAAQRYRGASQAVTLARTLTESLRALGHARGATLFMTLVAALDALLNRTTGEDDLAVGSVIANRNRPEIEGVIGFFVNTLLLRADLRGDPSFRELLERVRQVTLGAYAHQDLPFEHLVGELEPHRDLSRQPLFQVMFVLQNTPGPGLQLPGLVVDELPVHNGTAKFDLTFSLDEDPNGLTGTIEYNTDLYDRTTVMRLWGCLRNLLEAVAADGDQRLSELPLAGRAEARQLLREWNDTASPYPREATIHELFEAQAARTPEAVAVVFREQQLSYHELDRRANRLAHQLRACGVGPEDCVGLCAERSVEMVAATLGILKAGGAYVPLDPGYPPERLAFMLDDVRAPVLLAQDRLADRLPVAEAVRLISLDDRSILAPYRPENPSPAASAASLAYVMYTSGSTGRPKGVSVVHRGVVRLVREADYAELGRGEVFLQFAPISFDAATLEIWGALLNGGRLVVFPAHTPSLQELGAEIERHRVTTLWLTAGLFHQMVDDNLRGLSSVGQLLAGGDVLSAAHVRRVLEELPGTTLVNGYGPTESTTFTCCAPLRRAGEVADSVAIGRPIADTRVHVLDRRLRPVPVGVYGELLISGDGLARDYLNRPQLTAERFVPDPVDEVAGARLYRTGDLVRHLADGRIEFLGRRDGQVKLRGFRIELGEVEAALGRHPGVRESAVVVHAAGAGARRLVAFVVGRDEPAPAAAELRGFLQETLPDYMVPAALVTIESLPLTPNGKVDRAALARRAPEETPALADFVAPRTPAEEVMAGIWSQLLGRERIGVHDHFFELGGHSLLATQLVSRVRDVFGVELELRSVFQTPTLAALAARGDCARGAGAALAPPIRPLPEGHPLPLSFAQQRLWFVAQLEPESAVYNIPVAVRLDGPLNPAALDAGLREIARRHTTLRTRFASRGGEPYQVIDLPPSFALPAVDLAALAAGDREPELRRRLGEEARRPFDLESGPPWRARLLRLGETEAVLVLNIHHVASDGWSMGVLHRELAVLYEAFSTGGTAPLAELPIRYADFAWWQRQWLRGEVREIQFAYWTRQLAGMREALELPTDRPRPPVPGLRGATHRVALPPGRSDALRSLSRAQGATLFMTLLAAFEALLARITDQHEITVGTAVANRNRPEIEGLIGFFVNTVLLRLRLGDDPGFAELLARAREAALGAYAHQDLPFEQVVEELQPHRDLSRQPLFQAVFVLQNAPGPGWRLPGLTARALGIDNGTAKFDLTLSLDDDEAGLTGFVEYDTDLFDRTTILRLMGSFETLLAGIAADPSRRLSELPLHSRAAVQQLVREWNDTVTPYRRAATIHQLFEARASATPEAVAVVFGGRQVSYRELNRRANRLAHRLRADGVGPEVCVGLCVERSLEMVVGILGILKAGGAYVPLDPSYPSERLRLMLDDIRAPVLVAQAHLLERGAISAALKLRHIRPDGDGPPSAEIGAQNPSSGAGPGNLAYVMVTSGSTGRPKGVRIVHRSVVRLVRETHYAELDARQVFLQLAPISFDASTLELWGPLLNGGRLVVLAPHPPTLQELGTALARHRVTTLWLTAGLFHQMVDENLEELAPVRQLLAGGDVLSAPHVRRVLEELPGTTLVNGYGPTESTTFTCCAALRRAGEVGDPVAIGRPIANTRVHVLDRRLRPVPLGVCGELLIGGDGLARDYLNQPGLTAERFVPSPAGEVAGARLYRSGDLVRHLADGRIEFLGRRDFQVKLRGFRIELGEVEAALSRHPGVREAVVMVRENGARRLVAYVVRGEGAPELDEGELRAHLGEILPDYMVPAVFAFLEALPLTPNGKVDRAALSRRELPACEPASGFDGPGGPIEEILAAIWTEVLGAPARVGIHDDFFELGGHSLLATQMVSRVAKTLRLEVPLRTLFEHPTVAALARALTAALRREQGPAQPPLRPAARSGPPPLSFAQERLWFFDRFAPGSALYNVPLVLGLAGRLDAAALERALNGIARRHEVLRTTFDTVDGRPVQVIRPAAGRPLPAVDLAGLAGPQRRLEADRLARAEARTPFDLLRGPVLRSTRLRLGARQHALLLTVHHIAFDGWSIGVFLRELRTLYEAFSTGSGRALPELGIQYADFAEWQRRWLAGEVLESQLGYWREQLAALPVLELPTDRPRPAVQSFRGAAEPVRLPAALGRALNELSQRRGTTLFMTLLAAFQALLGRLTGQADLAVGTAVANRNRTEIEGLLGFFVNTLVLRANLRGKPSFEELLTRVRDVTLGAYAHQDLPFAKLVEELEPERDLGHNPLVQVHFVLQNAPMAVRELAPELAAELGTGDLGQAKFDLVMALEEGADGALDGDLEYRSDLFDAPTMRRMAGHFRTLLAGAVATPGTRVPQLPLLSAAERQQLVREWSHVPHRDPGDARLDELLAARAARRPEAIAVVSPAGRLSYGELQARAERLAAHLRALGVGPEVLVGLYLERSAAAVVGILGVLRAGGAYLPLDPAYPRDRLAFMLRDSGAPVVLTLPRLAAKLPPHRAAVVHLDTDGPAIAAARAPRTAGAGGASELAYAIYTSGSTGRPKGVLLAHRGVVGMAAALERRYDVTASSRVLLWASLSFDAAVAEIFTTLLAGGTLCLAAAEELLPGPALVDTLRAHAITNLTLVPSALQALPAAELPALRSLVVAGEASRGETLAPWVRGRRLTNAYGPTEATVCTTAGRVAAGKIDEKPSIGRPVAGSRVRVLDRRLLPVPAGVPGELLIGGGGLARGYLGRPQRTAAQFVPDPWCDEPGERLYRSGDLVRFLPGGELEFLGRIDQQVKIRGFRIELGEIEAVLGAHPGVGESVVAAAAPGLVAFVVRSAEVDAATLRAHLAKRLPEYMVPALVVFLEALPRTPSGKADRAALEGYALPAPAPDPGAGPRTPIEEVVSGIWTQVLGTAPPGIHANFFELGGHSLLVTQVMSRIRAAFAVEPPLRALFEQPTVAGLAAVVDAARRRERGVEVPALRAAARQGHPSLSFAQQRLWFLDQLEPGSSRYNVPITLRLDGALDPGALARAAGEIVRRHEVLRTRFATVGGEPVQVIRPFAGLALPVVELAGLDQPRRRREAHRLALAEARTPFDLARDAPLRAVLLRLGPREHTLLVTLHHIAFDGWSAGVLLRELAILYQALRARRPPRGLPALPVQYADFAVWQRRWLSGEVLERQLEYWREQLAGLSVLELPGDRPRPAVQSFRGAVASCRLPAALARRLAELGREHGATLFMTLLAAFQALLHRLTGETDLAVGTAVANRNLAEIEPLIGFFVNTLVLRGDLAGDPTCVELFARVRDAALGAYAHQDLPFEQLVEKLDPQRDLSHNPLVQVLFLLQNAPAPARELEPGLGVALDHAALGVAKFDLTLALEEREGELQGAVEYNTDLFDATTIRRLLGHFRTLLAGLAADPAERLSRLPLVTGSERHALLCEWSHTPYEAPAATLSERFAARVAQRPDAVAVVFPGGRLSYRELDARARRLASHLRGLGVGPEAVVGLFLERSPEALVGILGVLKAGGAYLPLDPAYPEERLAFILADAASAAGALPVVLTRERLVAQLPPHPAAVVRLDAGAAALAAAGPEKVPLAAGPSDLAYAIYTSGSTGRPKGVLVAHRGACAMAAALARRYRITASSRVLLWASLSFDAAAAEIFTTLLAGGTLCLAPDAELLPGPGLIDALRRHGVTNLTLVPSALQALPAAELPALRSLVVAGEACSAEVLAPWLGGRHLVNAYGPTEATVCTTAARISRTGEKPSIGRPVAGSRIRVLDRGFVPVPIGIPGELVIGGVGLARGYLGRPQLTAARFVPDPWCGEPGQRLYRSGDLVRFRPGGELEFLDRIDQQVKIRGFRIELGEIEAVLGTHPGVGESVVVAAAPGLVAFVVRSAEVDAATLRAHLAKRLPEYMVPAIVVFLESLPRTPSGKADRAALERRALPAPEPDAGAGPRTPIEEVLGGIWTQVLGTPPPGIHANFFELGGHSLLATQVMSRIRAAFGVEPPLRALFEQPTVAGLAATVDAALRRERGIVAPPLGPVARQGHPILSFAQQRLWLLDQLEPGSIRYNIPLILRLAGALDPGALARAMGEIVCRHEVLRTRFATVDGKPVQVIRPFVEPALPVVELAGLDEPARRREAHRLALAAARQPFDLARDAPLRAVLLRLAPAAHALVVTMHHIAFDGWSAGVLLRELAILYQVFGARRPPRGLPALPIQYADFAVWQRRWLSGEVLERQLGYWRERLSGLSVLDLPGDRPRPAVQSFRGAVASFRLPAALDRRLPELGREHGSTLFMTLMAAFQALLHRLTGATDLAVGTAVANRNLAEIEPLIGFFVNTLVLRGDLAGDPTCVELIARVRDLALGAYAHQDLPFEQLVEELDPQRDLSHNPLVQVMLMLQNAPAPARELAPGLGVELDHAALGVAKFDLTLALEEEEGELHGAVEYNTDLFDATTIHRLARHFRTLLSALAADPQQPLSRLPLVTASERHALLCEWSHVPYDAPAATLSARFAARVGQRPDAVAVVSAAGRLSYRELDARARQLAVHLRGLGVGPDAVVGLFLERSPEALVGILGVLKAGGAYLPLDPAYPRERLAFILEDAAAAAGARPVVLTRERLVAELPPHRAAVVRLDADAAAIAAASPAVPARAAGPSDLAYVIYTSGSTGRPKGVLVAHRGACEMAAALARCYRITASSRVLQWASLSFDAAVAEIFTTLLAGGTLCLASDEALLPGPALVDYLRAHEVTSVKMVPSALQAMPVVELPALRSLVVAGEACAAEVVAPWLRGRHLVNGYGPTEATVCATTGRISAAGEKPSIGRPVAASRVRVLDRGFVPVPIGVPGELGIGGIGLARGYLGRPALTAARFVPDPWCGEPGERLYRSGDLVRFLAGGELDFLGRIDQQVKVRGFRIELGEIEGVLGEHPAVAEAVVVTRQEAGGGKRLVAWVVAAGDTAPAPAVVELRRHLAERLPDYMVPEVIAWLEALPLLPNGKIDRAGLARAPLPDSEWGSADGSPTRAAPRSPVEEMLAEIWSGVLGPERTAGRVGVHADFFELGGHSLLAAQVISRVRASFGIDLPLRRLFEEPTVAALARSVEAALAAGAPLVPAVEPVPRHGRLPLSFGQQRLWFLDQLAPGDPSFNMPASARLPATLDRAVLARSLETIVARHEVLRTTIATDKGKPYQAIAAALPLELPLIDLRRLPRAAAAAEARRRAVAEGRSPFDLSRGPLVRACLLRLEDEHLLLLTVHHIIADGWSIDVLQRELAALYEAFSAGRPSPLPELPVQYADWAVWQRRWLEGEALEAQLSYWRERLREPLPVLELETDGARRSDRGARGGTCSLEVPESTAAGLRGLSRETGATLFMTLLAALDTLLYASTGQTDLLVGTPVANRNRRESEGLIGFFVNTLVLRVDLGGDPSFRELLARVRETALGAYAHADVPFEKLVEEFQPQRAASRTPLFQVMLLVHNAPAEVLQLGGRVLEPLDVHNETSQFDLTLVAADEGRGLDVGIEFDRELFAPARIERMLADFRDTLSGIVADPERRLSELARACGERIEGPAAVGAAEVAQPQDLKRQAKLSRRRARLTPEQRVLLERRLRGEVDPS